MLFKFLTFFNSETSIFSPNPYSIFKMSILAMIRVILDIIKEKLDLIKIPQYSIFKNLYSWWNVSSKISINMTCYFSDLIAYIQFLFLGSYRLSKKLKIYILSLFFLNFIFQKLIILFINIDLYMIMFWIIIEKYFQLYCI